MRTALVIAATHRELAHAYSAFRDDGIRQGGRLLRETSNCLTWDNGSVMQFCTAEKTISTCRGARYDEVCLVGTVSCDLMAIKMATENVVSIDLDSHLPCSDNHCADCYS